MGTTAVTYRQARWVVLLLGAALILGVTLTSFFLGADLVEVGAIAFLLPVVFVAAYAGPTGGALAGLSMSIAYVVIRLATLPESADVGGFVASMTTRVAIYLIIGVVGGAAMRQLESSLRKLELYDEIDDETGVGNARAVLSLTDRERARSQRYGSVFSIGIVEIDHEIFEHVRRKQATRAFRDFLQDVDHAARTSDAVARVQHGAVEQVMLVLPETGRTGAEIAISRILERAREDLGAAGMPTENGFVRSRTLTFPGDDAQLDELQLSLVQAMERDRLTGAENS